MTLGNWYYYRKKYKLIVLKRLGFSKNKTALILTYERNWPSPAGWEVRYFDMNAGPTVVSSPHIVIEKEFNDGKTEYEFLYKHGLKKTVPKIFWFIDTHVADTTRVKYCDNFDFVFVAQSSYIEFVRKHTTCKNIFWLPLCFQGPATEIHLNNAVKKHAVSFIGRYGHGYEKRVEMIEFLKEEYKDDFVVVTEYANMRKLIEQSRITTNYSLKDDLNFRVFEALAFGTEIITNYVPDMDRIEGLRERIHLFENKYDLKEKIDGILNNVEDKMHNVQETQQWIQQRHTFTQRLTEMLQMINTCQQIEYK